MRKVLLLVSWCGLALTLVPPFLFLAGVLEASTMKTLLLVGAALWFSSRISLWRLPDRDNSSAE